jgi:hypothetical protein
VKYTIGERKKEEAETYDKDEWNISWRSI